MNQKENPYVEFLNLFFAAKLLRANFGIINKNTRSAHGAKQPACIWSSLFHSPRPKLHVIPPLAICPFCPSNILAHNIYCITGHVTELFLFVCHNFFFCVVNPTSLLSSWLLQFQMPYFTASSIASSNWGIGFKKLQWS